MQKINVIVYLNNSARHIDSLIASLTSQTYGEFICYLIDDSSYDDTQRIIKKYLLIDSRFQFIVSKYRGKFSAYNTALLQSLGKYTVFLNDYDRPQKNFLEVLYKTISKHDMAVCDYTLDRISVDKIKKEYESFEISKRQFLIDILNKNNISAFSGVMIKTSCFLDNKFISLSEYCSEFEFIARILSNVHSINYSSIKCIETSYKNQKNVSDISILCNDCEILKIILNNESLTSQHIDDVLLKYMLDICFEISKNIQNKKGDMHLLTKLNIKELCRKNIYKITKNHKINIDYKIRAFILSFSHNAYKHTSFFIKIFKRSLRRNINYIRSFEKKQSIFELKKLKNHYKQSNKKLKS